VLGATSVSTLDWHLEKGSTIVNKSGYVERWKEYFFRDRNNAPLTQGPLVLAFGSEKEQSVSTILPSAFCWYESHAMANLSSEFNNQDNLPEKCWVHFEK
jgi:hypothetical protein